MNKCVILGRMVKDVDVRYTNTGKVVAQLTLAVDDGYGEKKTTSFIPVVIWGKTAELVGNSCKKGHRLLVSGRLQIRSYEAKDGTKRYVTEIIANSVDFIEKRDEKKDGMEAFGKAVPFDESIPF